MMKDLLPGIHNVVEICSAITIALLGLAYPIILDKISNIGDKYNSKYLLVLLNYEFFHKKRYFNSNIFQLTLYTSLISLVFIVLQFKPWFKWDNWFINNSASLITLVSTFILVIVFFFWLREIKLYIAGINELFKFLTKEYKGEKRDEKKQYYFKAINELAIYSVKNGDTRLEKDLLDFYTEIQTKYRKEYGE